MIFTSSLPRFQCVFFSSPPILRYPPGLGSDVGGSIRMPAFFNGIFGHKPSGGSIPNTGQHPPSFNDIQVEGERGLCCRSNLAVHKSKFGNRNTQQQTCVISPLVSQGTIRSGGSFLYARLCVCLFPFFWFRSFTHATHVCTLLARVSARPHVSLLRRSLANAQCDGKPGTRDPKRRRPDVSVLNF